MKRRATPRDSYVAYDRDIEQAIRMPQTKALLVETEVDRIPFNVYHGLRRRIIALGYAGKLRVLMLKGQIFIVHAYSED